ncbi:MAG: hypothetical protein EPN47_05405 [Acidobacteria bacterium]|nr:MAG: hypothetical protein EPN47_05405 [Acidobacteriota bacterium]
MFDILPCSAVPPDVPVPKGLQAARETSRNAFRSLPASPERDNVLGILGRIGKASLKQKIRHRAAMIISEVGERFPQLLDVTDEAVDCRNYDVHGSEPKFDYNRNFDAVTFFIDTLEFLFAASDLVEAGWNIRGWSKAGTVMSHPFGRLLINYPEGLRQLKQLLRP